MMRNKPFVKTFRTPGNYYLYDVNKNSILKIDSDSYDFLENIDSIKNSDIEPDMIKTLRKNSFLSSNKIEEMIHPATNLLPYYFENNLKMLTLQATQQCNFRCEYCIFSGGYSNRAHSNKKMSIKRAFKGIDFLIDHSKNSKEIVISFYGGEPLLEFDFIKKCIEYAEKKAEGRTLSFCLTTNGSLLNNDIVEYFIKHDVEVTISLDGPKEIHNMHRKFANSNKGTFDTVMGNIRNIEKSFPEYAKKIAFNAVVDPTNSFNTISKFFSEYEYVKDKNMGSGVISSKYSNSGIPVSDEYILEEEYEMFRIFYYKVKKKDMSKLSKLMMQDYTHTVRLCSEMLPTEKLPKKAHHGGPCIPGAQRLFMNVDGFLYPCEKSSEASKNMNIGHIDSGIDIEKAKNLLNVGKINEEACKNCWAVRLCTVCACSIDDTEKLSSELKREYCAKAKKNLVEKLKDYCVLKELGCTFEDEFNRRIKDEKNLIFGPECKELR